MNKSTGIVIGVVALVVIIGGIYISTNKKGDKMMMKEKETVMMNKDNSMEDVAMMEKDKMTNEAMMMKEKEGVMMEKDNMAMKDKMTNDVMTNAGSYETYSPDKVILASSTHNVVLFFRAGWCPTCIAVDKDIKANISNIPSDLAILDVNYDTSSDLKKKYGVTYQHTFVQVDKNGDLIKKWSGSPTLAKLVAEVK
jgi:thiol-disulfide isomerase/thioredoxin